MDPQPQASEPFARDYLQAREKFLAAAASDGLEVASFPNPMPGPNGEALFTDVVTVGRDAAPKVLLLNSGTHGVEGFCGSGSITGWLHTHPRTGVPRDVRVVAVHAINPYGFAWLRRVTEDNIDLNRNFIDRATALPENRDYELLHPHLLPDDWTPAGAARVEAALQAFAEQHGGFAMQAALSRGQYSHPDGLFFGGLEAGWSNRTFRQILREKIQGAAHAAFLDFHTGLGPYGHAELISKCAVDEPEFARLRAWFGPSVVTSAAGESTSPMLFGLIATALREIMPTDRVSALTVEYGTYPLAEILRAVVADNWLHARGEPDSARGRELKAYIKERFYPDDPDWRALVGLRSRQLIVRALHGLAAL